MIEFHISAHDTYRTGDTASITDVSTTPDQTTAQLIFDRLVLKYEADIAVGDMFVQIVARKPQ